MKALSRVWFVLFILVCRVAYADEVEKLYESEISVASELEADKDAAIQQALQIILTRILSGENILEQDVVKDVIANAAYYVREIQHSLSESDSSSGRLMRVLFDEKLLVDSLRSGKTGLWNEIRPKTLVWLIVEEDGQQQFFDPDLMPEVDLALGRATRLKKIPILYPIQDLNENQQLSAGDVLSAYSEHLLEVSTRYDVVSTLAGRLVNKGTCWKSEWTLYFDGKISQWSSQCGSIDEIAFSGIQGVYDKLSSYYAVTPEIKSIDSVLIKIAHINNMMDRNKVNSYLESLPMVKTVTWLSEENGYQIYRIFYQGQRSALNHALTKDHVLNRDDYSINNAKIVKYKLISD